MIGIYQIEVNGKKYIGQSIDIEERIKGHKRKLKKNKHENIYLQRAYNKYKEFKWEVLAECKKESLNNLESYYVEFYDTKSTGYNMIDGGNVEVLYMKDAVHNYKIKNIKTGEIVETDHLSNFARSVGFPEKDIPDLYKTSVNRKGNKSQRHSCKGWSIIEKNGEEIIHEYRDTENYKYGNAAWLGRKQTEEHKKLRAIRKSQKIYAISPEGIHMCIIQPSEFCRYHKVDRSNFTKCVKKGKWKGWTLHKI